MQIHIFSKEVKYDKSQLLAHPKKEIIFIQSLEDGKEEA